MHKSETASSPTASEEFTAYMLAAERLIAFRSRVEEAMSLIEGIEGLEKAVGLLRKQMVAHQLVLLKAAFDVAARSEAESSKIAH